MMFSIGRVPNPQNGRIGLQGARPLAERFQEAKDWALREIPANAVEAQGLAGLMISELSIDCFYDAVRAFKSRTYRPISPELQAEYELLCNEQRQYNATLVEIDELQKTFLWRCEHDWRHRLLRSTKADHFTKLAPIDVDWPTTQFPDIPSVREERRKTRAKLDYALELRGQIGNAASFHEADPVTQHEHLLHAAYDEITELRHSVKNLQTVASALEAQLGAMQAQPKPKRKVA